MSSDIAIKVDGVSKSFKLPHDKSDSIKSKLVSRKDRQRGYEVQEVLKDISFEVKKGEFFGIVGRNGSGKSTLLKIISQIYSPDKGSVTVDGKLTPFIELGVGFNPELSGRENVFLNGALLGFSRKEMEKMYKDIVEFAELERFMDQKLKNYSSGMQVRLAFSIAIRADTDILVLDEVLAVGDEAFQRKCEDYFVAMKQKKKTIILVTHSMDSVRKYCNKAIMLSGGEIVASGSPEDVANEYSLENLQTTDSLVDNKNDNNKRKSTLIKNLEVEVNPGKQISQTDSVEITVKYRVPTKIPTIVKLSITDMDRNTPVFASNSPLITEGNVSTTLTTNFTPINDANLKIAVSIRNEDFEVIDFLPERKAPTIALRRTDYPDSTEKTTWAILFDRGEWR